MPNHKATWKSLRRNPALQSFNTASKSRIRTLVKRVRLAVELKNKDDAQSILREAVSALDTAAKKHVIHPRNAARRKSRLMVLVNSLDAE